VIGSISANVYAV